MGNAVTGRFGPPPAADVAWFRERRKQRVYAAYAAAAMDPAFMAELDETVRAFDGTVADRLGEPTP